MPENEKTLTIIKEWAEKADSDLRSAAHLLKMKNCPTDTICFHSQQCVEKYLKALLVAENKNFPKTHDLGELIALLPMRLQSLLDENERDRFTDYATVTRSPGDYEPIPLSEARQSVKIARRVKREVCKLLEKKPLF